MKDEKTAEILISGVPKCISDGRIGALFKSFGALRVRRLAKKTMVNMNGLSFDKFW